MSVKFSVFIPVWNEAKWLPGAIESVLAQTHSDWELVIGDNASEDDLAAVAARYPDARIRYHRWPTHTDLFENHNRTVLLCQNEWTQMLSADDRLDPRCLQTMAERIKDAQRQSARVAMVVSACRRVGLDGKPADEAFYRHQKVATVPDGLYDGRGWLLITAVPRVPPWNVGSIAISREVLAETGGFCRPEIGLCADVEATLRVAAYGDVVYIDQPLLDYTVRDNSFRVPRFNRNFARGASLTPMGAALLSALAVHDERRDICQKDREAVLAVVAYWHLQRAAHHRYLPGGRGRRGAFLDVARAARYSPKTLLTPCKLIYALGIIAAPQTAIKWAKEHAIARRLLKLTN